MPAHPLRFRHDTVAEIGRSWRKVMVRDHDPGTIRRDSPKSFLASGQLPLVNSSIADRGSRCGRVKTDNHCSLQSENRIELVRDDLLVKLVRVMQTPEETIERDIVISRNHQLRDIGKLR